MAPKRRAASKSNINSLASKHSISSHQASSILESFSLFAVHHPAHPDEAAGILKREDVRRCLKALGIAPSAEDLPSILESIDPENEGFVMFEPFLEVSALYLNEQAGDDDDEDDALSSPPEDLSEDDSPPPRGSARKRATKNEPSSGAKRKGKRKAAAVETSREEINAAYQLFTKGGTGPITLQHLRRVARELREEISDDTLRDMILEANGEGALEGKAREGWRKGVAVEEFESIMKRAGVFG